MKYAVIFMLRESSNIYDVSIPDLPGCLVQAESVDDGLEKIMQAIQSHLTILAEYGEKIPSALTIESHRKNFALANPYTFAQAFWAVVNIDITPYLGKSHKINVTLPELLIAQIDDKVSKSVDYKTRSGFIACACLAELQK